MTDRRRTEAGYRNLGDLPVGCEVTWYRYFRYNGHRFNRGLVLEHLPSRYILGDAGITKFAVPLNDNRVLVVPMSSDMRIRLVVTPALEQAA